MASLSARGACVFGLVLLMVGCSPTYNGERLFWKAQQLNAVITKDPAKATPEQYTRAIAAYNRVVQQTPGTAWAARSHFAIGSLYGLQKQYEQAREQLRLILQNYNSERELCLDARLGIAKTYEAEQNIDEAVKMYDAIAEYHPWSRMGLEAPLYVAAVYKRQGKTELATKAYEHAVHVYTKLIPDAPTPDATNQVKGYLALAYQWGSEWIEAVKLLEEIVDAPSGVNRPLVLLTLGSIYQTKLGQLDTAEAVYRKLAQEFPEHPFGKTAKTQLEQMGQAATPSPSSVQTPAQ